MDSHLSQESDILNPSELDAIIGDLRLPDSNFRSIMAACDSTQQPLPPVDETNGNETIADGLPSDDLIRGPTGTSPSTEDYCGPYNFKIQLSPSSRRAWAYSEQLGKVFIDVNKVLLLQFSITPPAGEECQTGLRVRALLMYTSPDHFHHAVERCFIHWGLADAKHEAHPSENECRCNDFNYAGHVLTTNYEMAVYEYNKLSKRHSVVVPIDPVRPGYGDTIVPYQFGCKTSCQVGMSRRPARIIFTLEASGGEVVGRCSLLFKVCSCPKRDKEREEMDFLKSKTETATPPAAKRKVQLSSDANCSLESDCNGVPLKKKTKITLQEVQHTLQGVEQRDQHLDIKLYDSQQFNYQQQPMYNQIQNIGNETFILDGTVDMRIEQRFEEINTRLQVIENSIAQMQQMSAQTQLMNAQFQQNISNKLDQLLNCLQVNYV